MNVDDPALEWYRCSHCHVPVQINPKHVQQVEWHHAQKKHRGNPGVRMIRK